MLNAVLWLAGICVSFALVPEFNRSTWDWRRKRFCPRPEQYQVLNGSNIVSEPLPFLRNFYKNPYKKMLRRPFQYYPYYSDGPNFHPLLTHYERDQYRRTPGAKPNDKDLLVLIKNCGKSKISENHVGMNEINEIDSLDNDSSIKISKNDSMIISPSILIGRRNGSSSDDWILSNKPMSIYVKNLPESKRVFRIINKSNRGNKGKPKIRKLKKNYRKKKKEITKFPLTSKSVCLPLKCSIPRSVVKPNLNCDNNYDFDSNNYWNNSTEVIDVIGNSIKMKRLNIKRRSKKFINGFPKYYRNKTNKILLKKRKGIKLNKRHNIAKCKRNRRKRCHSFPKNKPISERIKPHEKTKRALYPELYRFSDYNYFPDYFSYDEYDVNDGELYPEESYPEESYPEEELLPPTLRMDDYSYYYYEDDYQTPESLNIYEKPQKNMDSYEYLISGVDTEESITPTSMNDVTKQNFRLSLDEKEIKYNPSNYIYKSSNLKSTVKSDMNEWASDDLVTKYGLKEFAATTNTLLFNPILLQKQKINKKILNKTNLEKTPKRISLHDSHSIRNATSTPRSRLDADENPVLDSLFISPSKTACEKSNKVKCVCSPDEIMDFFSNQLQMANDHKVLLKKLITFSCEIYSPINEEYRITSDMKPRLISRKKKELIESELGPKEISPGKFDELLMRGIPREGIDFYVFPSTTVEIPCFTSDEMKLSPNIADSAKYRWSHSNYKAITEGRILEDANHKGSLIIQDVTLGDTDNYTCRVNYIDPDSQDVIKRTFVHFVKVVTLPRLALHTNLHYSASSPCDQELLEMFELYLPQQIETLICHFGNDGSRSLCTVEIHNPVCYSKNKQDTMKRSIDPRLLWRTDFQKSRWIREILNNDVQEMEISLNYELDLMRIPQFIPDAMNWTTCSPHCQQKLSLKTIEILRDSFLEALLLPVKTKSVTFIPSIDSINMKMLTACDGGLELRDGFCVPCKEHFFSEQGKTVCSACPPGTYQDNIGAKSCVSCPHPFRSNCFSWASIKNSSNAAVWTFLICLTLVLMGYMCWGCMCVINKNFIQRKIYQIILKHHCFNLKREEVSNLSRKGGTKSNEYEDECSEGIETSKEKNSSIKTPEPLPPDFE